MACEEGKDIAQNVLTSLLIRWAGGFTSVDDADGIASFGVIEGFLSLGNVIDEATAITLGNAVLADQASVQLTQTGTIQPAGSSDTPYVGFNVGDVVTAPDLCLEEDVFRVQTIQVQEDQEGNPIYPVQVGTQQQIRDVRIQSWLQRMNAGTLAGTAQSAAPASGSTPPAATTQGIQNVWHMPGSLTVMTSDDWSPPRSGTMIRLDLRLTTAGSTATTVILSINHTTVIGSSTIAAGQNIPTTPLLLDTPVLGVGTPNATIINLYVMTAGTGAAGLVMTLTIL